ncbi:MAG: MFS transporter, partial [Acidimicrobiia bacterium]|nr:MFS transporter [Acidimicrobiia bacterium]
PGLAAVLLTVASWEWIFFVNIPLGLLALGIGWRVMPGPLDEHRPPSVDALGLAMVLAFNVSVLFAVDQFGPWSAAWLAGAVFVVWLYLGHASRLEEPVMKRRHLVGAPYGLLAWSVSLLLAGGIAVQSFFTLYIRGGRSAGEGLTAWSVFFFVIGWTLGANLSSRLLDRHADTTVMSIGFATTLASLAVLFVASTAGVALWILFGLMLFTGSGIGMATNAALTLLQSITATAETGRATSAHQFYRNLGFAVGAAVGGAVMLFVVARQVGDLEAVRELLAGTEGGGVTAGAIEDGFSASVGAALVLAAAGVAPMRSLRRRLAPDRALANEQRRAHVRYTP